MFGMVVNGTFAGPQIYLQPAKIKSAFWGFVEIFGLELSLAYED